MKLRLSEIAELVEGRVTGNGELVITGAAGLLEASPEDISFLANPKYKSQLHATRAGAVIVKEIPSDGRRAYVVCQNPNLAFARILQKIYEEKRQWPKGHAPSAILSPGARISPKAHIGALCVIEEGAEIKEGAVLFPGCYIGRNAIVGENCLLYPHVVVREECVIGARCIIHSGCVIGSDGFGFATEGGIHHKIPQVGIVAIEEDVEIGANCAIDRATTGKTVIGSGTKMDNLIQIAHNVQIGEGCLIVAQAGISGSTRLGKGVILAGQVGLVGHITLGDGAIVAAKSGVHKDIPAGKTYFGTPAREHAETLRLNALISRLPKLFEDVKRLRQKIK